MKCHWKVSDQYWTKSFSVKLHHEFIWDWVGKVLGIFYLILRQLTNECRPMNLSFLHSCISSELNKVHNQELQILEKTLKDAEAALSVSMAFIFYQRKSHKQQHYRLRNQCVKTLLSDFVVLCASTGTDWSADWGEQCSYWEANCRGEQEEGAGRKVSGTLICGLIIAQRHNISWLQCCLAQRIKGQWLPKDKLPTEAKINAQFLKRTHV